MIYKQIFFFKITRASVHWIIPAKPWSPYPANVEPVPRKFRVEITLDSLNKCQLRSWLQKCRTFNWGIVLILAMFWAPQTSRKTSLESMSSSNSLIATVIVKLFSKKILNSTLHIGSTATRNVLLLIEIAASHWLFKFETLIYQLTLDLQNILISWKKNLRKIALLWLWFMIN